MDKSAVKAGLTYDISTRLLHAAKRIQIPENRKTQVPLKRERKEAGKQIDADERVSPCAPVQLGTQDSRVTRQARFTMTRGFIYVLTTQSGAGRLGREAGPGGLHA
jgi:hypothetical protein